jgi:hypothetical protein
MHVLNFFYLHKSALLRIWYKQINFLNIPIVHEQGTFLLFFTLIFFYSRVLV